MADDEIVEESVEVEGAEFVPEVSTKPQPDVYTALLVIAFVAFFTGILLAGNELHDFYDVQFMIFSKR